METLPSYAKLSEVQLGVAHPDDAPRNVMNLKIPAAPKARELWAGEVAFAAMPTATLQAFLAWLSQFDGRQTAWLFPMAEGHQSVAPDHTGSLAVATEPGDASLEVLVTPGSGLVKAGTLLTLGTNTDDEYQVFEVLADASAAGETYFSDGTYFTDGTGVTGVAVVEVAPRVRWVFPESAVVTFGATDLRVRLAEDELTGHNFALSHGVMSVKLVEAVYA